MHTYAPSPARRSHHIERFAQFYFMWRFTNYLKITVVSSLRIKINNCGE